MAVKDNPSNSVSSIPSIPHELFESVELAEVKPEEAATRTVPGEFALKYQILPLFFEGPVLVVAIGAPQSLGAVEELGILLQIPTRAVLAAPAAVREKDRGGFSRTDSGGTSRQH